MSSCVIRKEDQPACQPWQMDNFDPAFRSVTSMAGTDVTLPTIEQICAIQEQARLEGYLAGQAEGRTAGHAQMAHEAARLHALAEAFSTQIAMADELISQQILDLAVDLAQAILKSTLTLRPELILPIVKEAVRYLPVLHAPALLYLNPDDAVLVKDKIGDELTKMGWLLTEDTQLEAGGCRVDTANNQIDAALPTRWQRLLAALGKHGDWLV
jgi:flagellar assembly protein FliH